MAIGASAGGVEAIATLLRAMPADIPAAFFVVSHVLPESSSHLVDTLNTRGPLTAKHAEDGEEFRHGFVYVAARRSASSRQARSRQSHPRSALIDRKEEGVARGSAA